MATAQQTTTASGFAGNGNDELDLTGFGGEDDLKGGFDYVKGGTYHVAFTAVDLQPTNRKKEYIDAKRFSMQILAGTDPTQVGKQFDEDLANPGPSHKDGGQFARKRLARLALKTGLISLADLGKRAAINWNDIVARQCVVVIEEREFTMNNGGKGKDSQVKGLEIYSVHDTEVAGVPKDDEALEFMRGLIPQPAAVVNKAAPAPTAPTAPAGPAPAPVATVPAPTSAPAATGDPFAGF